MWWARREMHEFARHAATHTKTRHRPPLLCYRAHTRRGVWSPRLAQRRQLGLNNLAFQGATDKTTYTVHTTAHMHTHFGRTYAHMALGCSDVHTRNRGVYTNKAFNF